MPADFEVLIWGGRGFAKVLEPMVRAQGGGLAAVFDRDPDVVSPFPHAPLLRDERALEEWLSRRSAGDLHFAIAVGSDNRERCALAEGLSARGLTPMTLVHADACVGETAVLGHGCQVIAGACISEDVSVGPQCIVNTNATVDHEGRLGRGVHIMPGATLAGCVTVGDFANIGANATILPRLTIGAGATVGAGAVVTRDVEAGATVIGSPAQPLRPRRERMPPLRATA